MRLTAVDFGLPEHVTCPFCQDHQTELHSAFGSQLSVATYWCRRCHTAFEYLKSRAASADGVSLP
jgi:transcription elongation factor Elf1